MTVLFRGLEGLSHFHKTISPARIGDFIKNPLNSLTLCMVFGGVRREQ